MVVNATLQKSKLLTNLSHEYADIKNAKDNGWLIILNIFQNGENVYNLFLAEEKENRLFFSSIS